MPTRKAEAVWQGTLKAGKGEYKGQTGLSGAYNFGSRFEEGTGSNPEELLAAAHAACYSMALSGALDRNGTPSTTIKTEGFCTVEKVGEGFKITKIKLVSRASVPGIEAAAFQEIAEKVKDGCPVSNALKGGSAAIELDAQLA
jgi:lipoyl-dependent peroxiredoxin